MKPETLRRHIQKMTPIFMEESARGGHYYGFQDGDGKMYPSATTLLKAVGGVGGLMIWHDRLAIDYLDELGRDSFTMDDIKLALKHSDTVRDAAADLGTRMHAAMERVTSAWSHGEDAVMSEVATQTEDIRPHVEKAVSWLFDRAFTPVIAEKMVLRAGPLTRKEGLVRQHPAYGGTVDMIALNEDGDAVVIDWKTGKSKNITHLMQMAAYSMLLPFPIYECHVVYTARKSKDSDEDIDSDGLARDGIVAYYDKFCMVASAYAATRKTQQVYDLEYA